MTLLLVLLPAALIAAPDGYSINSDSDSPDTDNLFRIDLANGNLTKIGIVAALDQTRIDVEGLAFAPDGVLYGVDESTMTLFPINTDTGGVIYQQEENLIGVNKGPGNDFGMTFACDEKLYLTSVLNDTLFTLSLDGTAEIIGQVGALNANISAIAAFGNPVRLYGLGNGLDGNNAVDSRTLYEIDITTGVATPVGGQIGNAAGDYKEAGLAFDEAGVLWAITDRRNVVGGTFPSQILQIDTGSGKATLIAETAEVGFESLAISVPTGCNDIADWPDEADVALSERAKFTVNKRFMDGNDQTAATLVLDCNTGFIPDRTKTIQPVEGSEGNYEFSFILTEFNDGELDCTISEEGVKGYTSTYDCDGDSACSVGNEAPVGPLSEGPCIFTAVNLGDDNICQIDNYLDSVELEITKVWVDEFPELENPTLASLEYECVNARSHGSDTSTSTLSGKMLFTLPEETQVLDVFPNYDWANRTTCSITEKIGRRFSSSVEPDSDDCLNLQLRPGKPNDCTFINSRVYEGIPTLSRMGLLLFAALMAITGLIASRRFA